MTKNLVELVVGNGGKVREKSSKKQVKVMPIGKPFLIQVKGWPNTINDINRKLGRRKYVNAFCLGEEVESGSYTEWENEPGEFHYIHAYNIQLYKIITP